MYKNCELSIRGASQGRIAWCGCGTQLLRIHRAPLTRLVAGQFAQLQATADWADAQGVAITDDGRGGRTPFNLTATQDSNRYLVANINSTDRGLSTLVLTRDANGRVTDARMTAIPMNQPDSAIRIDRLNIQRTQSAVLVTVDGVEYAIVGDDAIAYNDAYYRAMYEAPMFVFTSPFAPPTAVGGSASAKKVNVGGKLGIVKDPFGQAEYLGATLPLDGYGIINLALSEDGSVLIGQLKGGYSGNMNSPNYFIQLPNQVHAWDVGALIAAALAQAPQTRLSQHIRLPEGAEQLISPRSDNPNDIGSGRPIGTFFDPDPVAIDMVVRMGDVIEIDTRSDDFKRLIAHSLLKLPPPDSQLPADKNAIAAKATEIAQLMAAISVAGLPLENDDVRNLSQNKERGITLLTNPDHSLLTRDASGTNIGRFFALANLSDQDRRDADGKIIEADIKKLRAGLALGDKWGTVRLNYTLSRPLAGQKAGDNVVTLKITAKDYASVANPFVGDRPLDNPGYSTIEFVGTKGVADPVNAARVEQRLKYLGYGLSSMTHEEIVVDGAIKPNEQKVLSQFAQIVAGQTTYSASYQFPAITGDSSNSVFTWLNAYNAPHWMDFSSALKGKGALAAGWVNQVEAGKSTQGTSWIYDLMVATQAQTTANRRVAEEARLQFKGAGELGVMLNLGINERYVSKTNQDRVSGKDVVLGLTTDTPPAVISEAGQAAYRNKQWNAANAQALAGLLGNPSLDKAANPTNQQGDALKDFLAIYSAMLNDNQSGNGIGWDDIQIASAGDKAKIKEALFGKGDPTSGGLIDAKNILLGGTAAPLGSMMTAESLAAFMNPDGKTKGVDYAAWVKPLQKAMAEFGINTPQRIAAYLAQVKQETGGLASMTERIGPYRVRVLIDTFSGMFGGKQLTREQRFSNLQIFMKDVLGLTVLEGKKLSDPGVEEYKPSEAVWDTVKDKFADYYLSEDKGTKGIPKGNGKAVDKIAHNWIGRGFLHVTHFVNYAEFFYDISEKFPGLIPELQGQTKAQIELTLKSNPSLTNRISENSEQGRKLAALAGAWFWSAHGSLNDKASTITWGSDVVPDSQESEFNKISLVINQGDAFPSRWENYQKNVAALLKKGGNPDESLRAALARVGIATTGRQDYQQGFGLIFAPRQVVEIAKRPAQLLAAGEGLSETPDGPDLTVEQEAQLWAQAEPLFDQLKQSSEEKIMWVPDPGTGAGWLTGAVIAISAVSPAQAADNYVYGVCQTAKQSSGAEINPIYAGGSYLFNYHGNDPRYKEKLDSSQFFSGAKITLIKAPNHGKLVLEEGQWSGKADYHYMPDAGYFGKDRFVMQVEKNGVKVRIQYLIWAIEDSEPEIGICNPERWKISSPSDTPSLANVLTAATQNLTFADLNGSELGQTLGTGPTAQITLDNNAAGHGWYIDYTPYLNDEYLPTSNPLEWIARPGSEAAGKMDLLSVLLHEVGHALGLNHSADPHALMSTTLPPGVRRLPSAAELSLMAELLAVAKETGTASSVPYDPFSPPAPSFAILGMDAIRHRRPAQPEQPGIHRWRRLVHHRRPAFQRRHRHPPGKRQHPNPPQPDLRPRRQRPLLVLHALWHRAG